jgi:hypothetical protein
MIAIEYNLGDTHLSANFLYLGPSLMLFDCSDDLFRGVVFLQIKIFIIG